MRHRWAAFVLVLALCVSGSQVAGAQVATPPARDEPTAQLGQNYPNPFNPETRIPFAVGNAPTCTEHGKFYRVTLKIYNLLSQLVAVPVLQGGGGVSSVTSESGKPLENVALTCDKYTAYWDGKDMRTAKDAPSGIYYYRLDVEGKKPLVRKMVVTKEP